ncbi:MAG: gas vesicle protein GvpH [Minisyncoccales bacterium]
MVKKYKFKKTEKGKTDQAREELKNLEDLPLVGGLLKGLGKFVDLAERVEEAGGEIKKKGEIKSDEGKVRGIYGFSIKSGIGERPKFQTFGNIKPIKKEAKAKPEFKITETREPMVDVFNEKDHVLIVAELPGVSEDSINLDLKGDILILEAGDEKRKYSKEILLPRSTSPGRSPGGRAAKVDFDGREENFKNGVLEVKMRKI